MARRCSVQRANQKIGGFASAKKNVVIQYQGRERSEKNLLDLIYQNIIDRGIKEEEIEDVDIYVKPEEQAVFYVVNKKIEGQIAFQYTNRTEDKYGNNVCDSEPEGWYW